MTSGVATLYGRFDTIDHPGCRAEQRVPVDRERVAFFDSHRASVEHFAQHGYEMAIELERDDLRRARVGRTRV